MSEPSVVTKALGWHHRQMMVSARNCSYCWEHRTDLAALPATPAETGLREALKVVQAKADAHRQKAERTAISNEDWRYSNGYNAAVKDLHAALGKEP